MELEYWSSKGNYGGNVQESVGKRGFQVNKRSMQRDWSPVLGVAMMAAVSVRAQAPEQSAPPPATQTAPAPAPAQSPVLYQTNIAVDPARSESEAQAMGYKRVVLLPLKEYKK